MQQTCFTYVHCPFPAQRQHKPYQLLSKGHYLFRQSILLGCLIHRYTLLVREPGLHGTFFPLRLSGVERCFLKGPFQKPQCSESFGLSFVLFSPQ